MFIHMIELRLIHLFFDFLCNQLDLLYLRFRFREEVMIS